MDHVMETLADVSTRTATLETEPFPWKINCVFRKWDGTGLLELAEHEHRDLVESMLLQFISASRDLFEETGLDVRNSALLRSDAMHFEFDREVNYRASWVRQTHDLQFVRRILTAYQISDLLAHPILLEGAPTASEAGHTAAAARTQPAQPRNEIRLSVGDPRAVALAGEGLH